MQKIRPARPEDCSALTELALNSKAYWGYTDAFILACKPFLSITRNMITDWHSGVIENEQEIAGFYFLSDEQGQAELQLLYIEPSSIGNGYGRCLFNSAVETAIRLGYPDLRIEADPNAVGFYRKMGARQTGWCRSDISDERELPLMMLDLSKGAR